MEQKSEVYHIVAAPNDKYMRYTLVLFESIFVTNPGKHFHFHVLHSRLGKERMDQVTEYVTARGGEITFICVDESKYRELPSMTDRISIETYFRLEIQDLLPEEVERALYLDGDMIVCGDLAELYHTDFEGNSIAACGFSARCEQGGEFNAGMILFNLKQMRGTITFETYRSLAERMEEGYYMDQGLLNELFGKDATKYVWKQRYNFTCPFYRKFKKQIETEDASFTLDDVVVMHYTGPGIRPWEAEFTPEEIEGIKKKNLRDIFASNGILLDDLYFRFLSKWWEHAANTPVYEELKHDMYESKSRILSDALLKTIDTKEYAVGYRILRLARKIKR